MNLQVEKYNASDLDQLRDDLGEYISQDMKNDFIGNEEDLIDTEEGCNQIIDMLRNDIDFYKIFIAKNFSPEDNDFGKERIEEAKRLIRELLKLHYHDQSELHESFDDAKNDAESICRFLDKHNFTNYELYDYDTYPMDTSMVMFVVEGDWKHDHWLFKDLVNDWAAENGKNIFKIDTAEVGNSDSDYYTAQYHIYIAKDNDSLNTLHSMRRLFDDEDEYNESLNEELWDRSRVVDLVGYYLDKYPYAEEDAIVKVVKCQMKKEGSVLPSDDKEFMDAYYSAVDYWQNDDDDVDTLEEDTIKTKDGKWTNKGKEGTHGKFNTKKEADAQRRAMFAGGYKESLEEDKEIKRYSDTYSDEDRQRGWWYFTTHGVMPGSIPKDLHVLEVRDGKNNKGMMGTFVRLDGILNTSELKYYDMIELTPIEEIEVTESLNEAKSSKYYCPETGWHNSPETYKGYQIRLNSKNETIDIYDKNGELEDGGFLTYPDAIAAIDNLYDESLKESINDFPVIVKNIELPITEGELKYYIDTFFKDKYIVDFIDDVRLVNSSVDEANRKYYNLKVNGFFKDGKKMFKDVPVRVWENGKIEDSRNSLPPVENVIDESLNEDDEYKTLAKLSKGLEVISYPYGYAITDGFTNDRLTVSNGDFKVDDGRFNLSYKDKDKIRSLIKRGVIKESLNEGDYDRPGFEDMYLVCWDDRLGDYHEAKVKASYPQEAIDKVRKRKNVYKIIDCKKVDMFISPTRVRKAEVVESLKESLDYDYRTYQEYLSDNFDGYYGDYTDELMKELGKCAKALKTTANKLIFYTDYDEKYWFLYEIGELLLHIDRDYDLYQVHNSDIKFVYNYPTFIFKNQEEADEIMGLFEDYAQTLDENLVLEGLVDISDDFELARRNWKKLNLNISFDDAIEQWNNESELADPDWYAKPLYSAAAWDDMVNMFKNK